MKVPRFVSRLGSIYTYEIGHRIAHKSMASRWAFLLRERGLSPSTLVDVGSNDWHLAGCIRKAIPSIERVLSFDPMPPCAAPPWAEHMEYAIGTSAGTVGFDHWGSSGTVTRCGGRAVVTMAPLDQVLDTSIFVGPGTILKVDAETHTYDALVSAGRHLSEFDSVVCEMWNDGTDNKHFVNNQARIMGLLLYHGFKESVCINVSQTQLTKRINMYDLAWFR